MVRLKTQPPFSFYLSAISSLILQTITSWQINILCFPWGSGAEVLLSEELFNVCLKHIYIEVRYLRIWNTCRLTNHLLRSNIIKTNIHLLTKQYTPVNVLNITSSLLTNLLNFHSPCIRMYSNYYFQWFIQNSCTSSTYYWQESRKVEQLFSNVCTSMTCWQKPIIVTSSITFLYTYDVMTILDDPPSFLMGLVTGK